MSFLDDYFIIFGNFNIYTKFGALSKIALSWYTECPEKMDNAHLELVFDLVPIGNFL